MAIVAPGPKEYDPRCCSECRGHRGQVPLMEHGVEARVHPNRIEVRNQFGWST
jgi:hypothetical protein